MPSPNNQTARPPAPSTTEQRPSRTALAVIAAAVVGLLAGYLIQNSRLNGARNELARASGALQAARLEATLGAAVIESQSGRFEPARQRASDFYTGLQRRLLPVIVEAQQGDARAILSERDSVITSLARNDPASTGALASALVRFREVIGRSALDTVTVPAKP